MRVEEKWRLWTFYFFESGDRLNRYEFERPYNAMFL